MTRVLSVSSSRADVGILTPVWNACAARGDVDLHVLFTGMHTDADAVPETPAAAHVHRAGRDLGGQSPRRAAEAMAAIAADTAALLEETPVDAMLVIGDRLDMLPAAIATLPFNLPLAHLHGGEVTEGAIDDRVRHALTKLAHVHCAAGQDAAARLSAMGEEPWRIHITGAPGLDTLKAAPEIEADTFAGEVGLSELDGLRLVTVHPETNALDSAAPLDATLSALDAHPAPTLFTAPNADPGGDALRQRILDFVAERPWAGFRDTLGARLYANALRHAAVMVGNSSSGIIEAALFGLPVIDVGDRQKGRARGANVHTVAADAKAIAALIERLTGTRTDPAAASLYGDGAAGPRVADVLAHMGDDARLLRKRMVARA